MEGLTLHLFFVINRCNDSETTMRLKNYISEAVFNVGYNSSDDTDIQSMISFLQGSDKGELVLVSNPKGTTFKIKRAFVDRQDDIKKFIADKGLKINFASQMFGDGSVGSGGKKVPGEVQEMITACLVLLGFKKTSVSQEEAVDLIEKCKEVYSKVDGADRRPDFLDFFHGNFSDLASAISASKYILGEVGSAKRVFWTGKGWDKAIAHYNPKIGNIRDYNSSDIVVQSTSGKFYGYSLKKKASVKSPDPTLINKPITGNVSFLQNIIGKASMEKINRSKTLWFNSVIAKRTKGVTAKDLQKMPEMKRNKLISAIDAKDWGIELKNPRNIFFARLMQIIKIYDQEFIDGFLKVLFRTELTKTLKADEFEFTLLTGIGTYSGGELSIEKASGQELNNIVTALQDIYKSKLKIVQTSGKVNAYEKGATAAKVFLTIESDKKDMVNIEIRYKGSYTANPQLQAVATANFKNIFKK